MGAAVVIISFPLAGPGAVALGLDGKHHALAAKGVGNLGDQLRAFDGRRVDGNLIRPHGKNVAHILDAAQTAAHADRDIHIIHGFAHNIRKVVTVIQAGHNINVQQLVNALLIIFPCKQVGIPQLAQALQLDAFDEVGILDIQPCNQADFFLSHKKFLSSRALGQHRTIPALRLKHRSGSCGTASALPKCSIMSGCGTRIVLRGQKPLALCDRCPCFGSLFPPLAALTFAASSIICAFGLASAAPRSPYRHLELCGIALVLIFRGGCPSGRPKALRCRPRRGCDAVSTCCPPISKGGDCGNGRPGA